MELRKLGAILALITAFVAAAGVSAFEIKQDFEGSGDILSRIDGQDGGSVLQSSGNVIGGRIFKTGGDEPYQFAGLQSTSGRFKVWSDIGADYTMSMTGDMYATATISQTLGDDNTTEGGEISVNATLGSNGTIDESLISLTDGCKVRPVKLLETEASLGENDSMVLKSMVGWP